jgi:SPP1 gp7 family putative phage head morphogenesis protein
MAKNNNYWNDRVAMMQDRLEKKRETEINRQIKKYYKKAMETVIQDFEDTYNALEAKRQKGEEISIANLYRLDRYWRMQGQLKQELERLGDKQAKLLSRNFETFFFEVYNSLDILGDLEFTRINSEGARHLINAIWCADGKSFSQRIWGNTNKLVETLNEELVNCIVTGKKSSELKKQLRERFGVSHLQTHTLVKTEMTHIQSVAAKQRYIDMGVQKFKVWASEDERRCDICGKLHESVHDINENIPVPAHPRCRCRILPVIDV